MGMKFLSVIGILLFLIILLRIDIPKTFSLLANVNIFLLIFILLHFGVEVILRSQRWRKLTSPYSHKYSLSKATVTYLIGIAFGSVTPAKAGDLVKSYHLRSSTKIPLNDCISLSVFDKIADALFLFGSALLSLIIIPFMFPATSQLAFPLAAIIITCLAIGLFLLHPRSRIILLPMYKLFVPKMLKRKARDLFYSFRQTVRLSKKILPAYIILSIIAWFLFNSRTYFFLLSLGVTVPFWISFLLTPLVVMLELLPISILGLGTREASLIILYSLIGVSNETLVATSFLMLFLIIIPQTILGFILANRGPSEGVTNTIK